MRENTKTKASVNNKLTSELETKKAFLHKLIDGITVMDYVEADSRMMDISGKSQVIHKILIEKNGNLIVAPKRKFDHDCNHNDDDDDDNDGDTDGDDDGW